MDSTASEASSSMQGLRANHLSAWEAIGQSLATLAPTAGPAIILPLALVSSGNGTWLVFVIATLATICIGYEINTFARLSSSPGSLYTYVGQELPSASIPTAWALLLAYIGTGSGAACSLGLYLYALLFPHSTMSRVGELSVALVAVLGASLFAWFDVKISTRLMLGLEALSVGLILLLFALPGHGSMLHLDRAQLMLTGVTVRQIRGGLVLAIYAFVGFESAAALGGEVMEPLRNIPRAILGSVLIGGAFFIVCAYAEQVVMSGQPAALAASAAPLKLLAQVRGYPAFGPFLMAWCVVSAMACTAACIQATARTLYGMSRDGQCAAALGRVHPRRQSPHIAILVTAAAVAVPPTILILMGLGLLDAYGWIGTFATFGFLTAYALITIAAVRVQLRTRTFGVVAAVCATVIACVLALSVSSAFDASATGVYRVLPYLYVAAVAIGVAGTVLLRRTPAPDAPME